MDFTMLGNIWDTAKAFFTVQEWIALFVSIPIGTLITEPSKRYLRAYVIKPHQQRRWFWPLAGFLITYGVAFYLWPGPSHNPVPTFPYPLLAATILAFGSPVIYKLTIALLRKKGYDRLADILTGEVTVKQAVKGEA